MRRVRPPAQYEELLSRLTDGGLFERKQAVLMFAAALGYFFSTRKPLGSTGEGIRWDIFERNQDDAFIYALALADAKEIGVLDCGQEDSRAAAIFEEYAAAGLEHLSAKLAQGGDALEVVLGLIADARGRDAAPAEGLEGLSEADLEFLGG